MATLMINTAQSAYTWRPEDRSRALHAALRQDNQEVTEPQKSLSAEQQKLNFKSIALHSSKHKLHAKTIMQFRHIM